MQYRDLLGRVLAETAYNLYDEWRMFSNWT